MRDFVIVGRPNSGKTMFVLNFAKYLGSKTVDIISRSYDGLITCRHLDVETAKRELCGANPHKTRLLQSMVINIKLGKAVTSIKLTDTCGLIAHIHNDENIRKGMAQTLGAIRSADFIFHMIDLSCFNNNISAEPDDIDFEIYRYGIAHKNYVVLANKIDIQVAKLNKPKIVAAFPNAAIIYISALLAEGFKEVKTCVAHNI